MGELENISMRLDQVLQAQKYKREQAEELRSSIEATEEGIIRLEEEKVEIGKALDLIVKSGDEVAKGSYDLVEQSVNSLLHKMFRESRHDIAIDLGATRNIPTLEIALTVNGVTRTLDDTSGRGLSQALSLVSLLCIILLDGSRRLLVLDEVLTGVSVENKPIITELLKAFTDIGYQFIICEHNFIPDGARVYELKNVKGDSSIVRKYIQGED